MIFNINDWVKVKLTPYGKRVMESQGVTVKVDNEGKTSFQFWIFMNTFRDYWYATAEAVIEGYIEVVDPQKKTKTKNLYRIGYQDGIEYCKQRIDELFKQHTREGKQ